MLPQGITSNVSKSKVLLGKKKGAPKKRDAPVLAIPKPQTNLPSHPLDDIVLNDSLSVGSASRVRLISISQEGGLSPITEVVTLIAEPIGEDIGSETFLPTTTGAASVSPVPDELAAHAYPESGLVAFVVDEVTRQNELPGSVLDPLPELGSQSTEILPLAASSQAQEFETEELASTSPSKESTLFLIDTNGSFAGIEDEAPAFQSVGAPSNTDPREPSLSTDGGATNQDDLLVSIPASSSPLPELPASNTESPPPPQPHLLIPVQETQPEAPSQAVEVEAVADSPSSGPAPLPINAAEAEPRPPVVPVALRTNTMDVNLKEDSESIKSKSDRSKVTAVGKKAFKSFKGAFGSSKSKAAGSGLTSPSTDTLASVESQGKASINSAVETAANLNKGGFSSSQDSLVSNKTGLSIAKGGMKRLFGSKDKAKVPSPSLEPIPSVETQGSSSDHTLTPVASGLGMKKQRQQTIDNGSPMLKGMFKGRNPLRKPTI